MRCPYCHDWRVRMKFHQVLSSVLRMEGCTLYAACILEIGPISLEAGFELLDISTGWTVYFMMHFFGVRILTTHLKIEK